MQHDPEETADEYDARRDLFVTSRPEIVRRPGMMSGDWIVWGTRVRPEAIIEAEIAGGQTEKQIRRTYPTLPEGVVEAVRQWRRHVDLIMEQETEIDVLDFVPVELSPAGHTPIAFLAQDRIGIRGGWVRPTAREYIMRDASMEHDRLTIETQVMAERWRRKIALAAENLDWEAWQARVDEPGPLEVKITGSGDLQVDLGYAQPRKVRLLFDLLRALHQEIYRRHMTPADVAAASGMTVGEIDKLLSGVVTGRDVYDLLWILSRLGKRVVIDLNFDPPDGIGSIVVEQGW